MGVDWLACKFHPSSFIPNIILTNSILNQFHILYNT
jgi:hypothetical protein